MAKPNRGPIGHSSCDNSPDRGITGRQFSYANNFMNYLNKTPQKSKLLVAIRFNGRNYTMSLIEAVKTIKNHLDADYRAFIRHRRIMRDNLFASFVTSLYNESYPPSYKEWQFPRTSLNQAINAYHGQKLKLAEKKLREGLYFFNHTHRKWYIYQKGVQKGGKEAIQSFELVIMAVTAIAGGAIGGGLIKGAGVAMAFKGGTELSKEMGKVYLYNIEKEMNWHRVCEDMAEEVLTNLVGGVLFKPFIKLVGPLLAKLTKSYRFTKTFKIDPELAEQLFKGKLINVEKNVVRTFFDASINFLKEAVKKASAQIKDKKVTGTDFLRAVADEFTKSLFESESGKQALGDLLKKLASTR